MKILYKTPGIIFSFLDEDVITDSKDYGNDLNWEYLNEMGEV